jgi:pyridoxine kinase
MRKDTGVIKLPVKRVAAIHDMSGFGRCSLTVAIPVLSAMGAQCCPLPTAYLSTHTAGFGAFTFKDLTDQFIPVSDHWESLGLTFDAIYSGFLASSQQIGLIKDFIRRFSGPDTIVLVDPVMGDEGKPYKTYTPEMCAGMGSLISDASVITPNLTEASILLGKPFESVPADEAGIREWLTLLSNDATRSVVITGVSFDQRHIGAASLEAKSGKISFAMTPWLGTIVHGTGDLFASVLLGSLLRGDNLGDACRAAADFVHDSIALYIKDGTPMSTACRSRRFSEGLRGRKKTCNVTEGRSIWISRY